MLKDATISLHFLFISHICFPFGLSERARFDWSVTMSSPRGHFISNPAPPIRAFVESSRDYCNAGVWVSNGHNSLVTLADFLAIASPSLSQHIFHLADKISHSLMSFRQATVLCLSKCFYRETPQAVNSDQSYSGCAYPFTSHMFFCRPVVGILTMISRCQHCYYFTEMP